MEQNAGSHNKLPLKVALWSLVVLCLGLVVVMYFFGGLIPALAALLLLVIVAALAVITSFSVALPSTGAQISSLLAIVLGLIGSVIAVWSALSAFRAVGSDPAYSYRLWAVWAALLLPVLAAIATLFLRTRPIVASILILVFGIAGAVCINLFYINTFYVLAIPFWILAVAVGLVGNFGANTRREIL